MIGGSRGQDSSPATPLASPMATSQILRNLCGSGRGSAKIFHNLFWKYRISSCTDGLRLKQVLSICK